MFTDYHVHTEFSDVDYGIKRDWNDAQGMLYRKGAPGEPEKMPLANVNYPKYFEKIEFFWL